MKLIITLLLISFALSPSAKLMAQEALEYTLHPIEKGESLYSISKTYNIDREDIIRLNPGCEKKIYEGNVLRIPQNVTIQTAQTPSNEVILHTVEEGETLYKLTVLYKIRLRNIIEANPEIDAKNLKVGDVVRIPISGNTEEPITKENRIVATTTTTTYTQPITTTTTSVQPVATRALLQEIDKEIQASLTLKVSVILPSPSKNANSLVRRNRFYEGFQAAVDSLKKQNITIDLSVYNVGNEASSINTILAKSELRYTDIIYAPLEEAYIKPLITFSNDHNIPLVIPRNMENIDLSWSPNTYLVKAPSHYLYQGVYECFLRKFPSPNVILLDGLSTEKDKETFISGLKNELINKGAPVQTLNGTLSVDIMKATLRLDKENVFILTSGSYSALSKSISHIKKLIKDNPEFKISLFGYPEWQNYTGNHMIENLFEVNAYIYSSHYNNSLNLTQTPATTFLKWYQRRLSVMYPSDKTMGFETTYFFLKGLFDFGRDLSANIKNADTRLIKNELKFEQVSNGGGYINKDIFFINYSKDLMLNKLVFK